MSHNLAGANLCGINILTVEYVYKDIAVIRTKSMEQYCADNIII